MMLEDCWLGNVVQRSKRRVLCGFLLLLFLEEE